MIPILLLIPFTQNINILCTTSLLLLIPSIPLTILNYIKEDKKERIKKAKETQLKYLKNELKKQREELNILLKNKTNKHDTKDIYVSLVKDKEKLIILKNYLEFYYNLGYNEDKYLKYYQKGQLDKKLKYTLNENEINNTKEHLKEKTLKK